MIYNDYREIPADVQVDIGVFDPPWNKTGLDFDKSGFDLSDLAERAQRWIKPNGWLLLFGTLEMAVKFLPFFNRKFECIWVKPAGIPSVKAAKRPMMNHEIIWFFIQKDLKQMADLYMDKAALRTDGEPYAKMTYGTYVPTSGKQKGEHVRGEGRRMDPNTGYREGLSVLRYGHKGHGMPRNEATDHPTQKPLDLVRLLVRAYCPPGGLVLDPTLGSGTTAEAAELENRRWVGAEINPEYREIIRGRVVG